MEFAEYYRTKFRNDLSRFMLSIPVESRHHGNNAAEITIQYSKLSQDLRHLKVIEPPHVVPFAIAVYLTVLTDEVFYTYFKVHYSKFRRLTQYPKFIGDCLGACRYHYHPNSIFDAINKRCGKGTLLKRENIFFREDFIAAIPTIKAECEDFFENNMPEIDKDDFWQRCVAEFPYRDR